MEGQCLLKAHHNLTYVSCVHFFVEFTISVDLKMR